MIFRIKYKGKTYSVRSNAKALSELAGKYVVLPHPVVLCLTYIGKEIGYRETDFDPQDISPDSLTGVEVPAPVLA